ncbi:MAG: efflux RND transporter periplasmic adaptor subunit [Prevotellaceae bacterium]|jgi:hypothetical protein|nr:efflux RND transporter periplasmic adaptor subunit [Prevotellaceae bacterium]
MKRKRIYLYAGIAAAVIIAIIIFNSIRSKKNVDQKVKVQQGLFEIVVGTTGDLQAISMELIEAPAEMRGRNIRIQDVKILDLVAEGTVVDSGQYVASLDRSTIDNTAKTALDELEQLKNTYESTLLDTSLNLQNIRDNIVTLQFALEEAKITVEQSIYEPPATQRQAQNNLEKAQRNYDQEVKKYALKQEQELAKVKEIKLKVDRKQSEYDDIQDIISKFTIKAPKSGMVIYYKDWSGEKRKVGSTVSPWDRTVATLPDLSTMVSKTYVNEIDISKVKKGQKVRIGVDAFPEKKYTGLVTDVANIGEQLRNADAKVFEVMIRLNESDPILRPSMTTSNQIVTSVIDSVLYLPLEAMHGDDSITYVYRTNNTKQVVVTGEMNDNYRIIEQGLKLGDEVYLSTPEKAESFNLVGEEYIPIIKERAEKKRKEEEERKQEAARQEEMRKSRMMMGRGGMMPGVAPGGATITVVPGDNKDGAAQQRQRPQMDMSNLPKEIQDAAQKGDTAAVRKYMREQRSKQQGEQQPAQQQNKQQETKETGEKAQKPDEKK